MVREDKKEHRGADVNREREKSNTALWSSGETEAAAGPGQALCSSTTCPPQDDCNLRDLRGERAGEEGEGGTFLGHPRPAQAPVHPGTQRQPPRAAEVFRSLPQGGPGSLAVVTDPEEQCGGSGRGRGGDDGGRGEAAWRG